MCDIYTHVGILDGISVERHTTEKTNFSNISKHWDLTVKPNSV